MLLFREISRRPDDGVDGDGEEDGQRVKDVEIPLGGSQDAVVPLSKLDDSEDGSDLPSVSL
jgi:hypothetical protein